MTKRELLVELESASREIMILRTTLRLTLRCLEHNPAALEPGGDVRKILEDEDRAWRAKQG